MPPLWPPSAGRWAILGFSLGLPVVLLLALVASRLVADLAARPRQVP
ncbi:hypothetical protein [Micromonospora sp. A3M-1-15]|nr:hypothetical protein [Micromonospora sp. A3M-1-15]MCP3783889.1 hypothetical protein [Micromonospora sp. A3M-1-15]